MRRTRWKSACMLRGCRSARLFCGQITLASLLRGGPCSRRRLSRKKTERLRQRKLLIRTQISQQETQFRMNEDMYCINSTPRSLPLQSASGWSPGRMLRHRRYWIVVWAAEDVQVSCATHPPAESIILPLYYQRKDECSVVLSSAEVMPKLCATDLIAATKRRFH